MSISREFQIKFIELVDELNEKNRTQRANIIGISNTTYSNAYNYGIMPKTSSLIRIADYFNVSVEFLIGNTDNDYFKRAQVPKTFNERLEELRVAKGINSVYALSQSIHIHRNNIAQWIKLDCIPLIDDVVIIADFFDVSIDYLLGRTDDESVYK